MELNEMITDALIYPSNNVKALAIYILLSAIVGIVTVATGVSALLAGKVNPGAGVIVAIIGVIVLLILSFAIQGYSLDIIKIAIERGSGAPVIDFNRQVSNGLKYFVVSVVYMIVPIVISVILALFLAKWLVTVLAIILTVIFLFGLSMAECRLAKTENLAYALDIRGSINDLMALNPARVVTTIVVATIIYLLVTVIISAIVGLLGSEMLTSIVGSVVGVYMLFFLNRVMGLLYSEL